MKRQRTIDKIITPVSGKYGAPMGRPNFIPPITGRVPIGQKTAIVWDENKRIFDCGVPMPDGCYDKGGAYWGHGNQLRVQYTKDLSYIRFYRVGDL